MEAKADIKQRLSRRIKSLERQNTKLVEKEGQSLILAVEARKALVLLHTEIVSEVPCTKKMEHIINIGMQDNGLKINSSGQYEWRPNKERK